MATTKNVSTENKINIVTNTENSVTVTQPSIQAVEVLTGPQGNKGDAGPAGPTGSLNLTSSLGPINIEGDLTVTGSVIISSSLTASLTSGYAWVGNSNNIAVPVATSSFSGGGNPAGTNGDIQFNLSGSFGSSTLAGWFSFKKDLNTFIVGRNPVVGSSALYSIYSGENNIQNARDSIVSGENNLVNTTSRGSIVNGRYNTASAAYSFVTGKYNYIATDNPDTAGGFVTGFSNRVLANYGVALGFGGVVVGNSGVTVGEKTTSSFYGLAAGSETYAGFAAVATGNETTANSRYTLTGGSLTKAGGPFVDLLYISSSEPQNQPGTGDIDTNQKWYNPDTDILYIYVGPSGAGNWVSQNDYSPYIQVTYFNTSSGIYSYPTFSVGDSFAPFASGVTQARTNYGRARFSHAEGSVTTTFGRAAHAEGQSTEASGWYSHAEGNGCRTGNSFTRGAIDFENGPGSYAHAEGIGSVASGYGAHAQGYFTYAIGTASFSSGLSTFAQGNYQAVFGKYNNSITSSNCLLIIGNGTSSNNRRNLVEFNTNSVLINQPVTVSSNISSSGTIFANDLIIDYDSLPTSDPAVKGQVYRNGSNQLFVSAG